MLSQIHDVLHSSRLVDVHRGIGLSLAVVSNDVDINPTGASQDL